MNCEAPIDLKIKTQLMCDIYNMVKVELYDSSQVVKSNRFELRNFVHFVSSDVVVSKTQKPYPELATTSIDEQIILRLFASYL